MAMTKSQIQHLLSVVSDKQKSLEKKREEAIDRIDEKIKSLSESKKIREIDLEFEKKRMIEKQEKIFAEAFKELDDLRDQLSKQNVVTV